MASSARSVRSAPTTTRADALLKGKSWRSHGPGSAFTIRTGPANPFAWGARVACTEMRVLGIAEASCERSTSAASIATVFTGTAANGSSTAFAVARMPATTPLTLASIVFSVPPNFALTR